MAYWPSILQRSEVNYLDRAKHLAKVTTLPDTTLDALCEKFNFAKNQVLFRKSKDTLIEHFQKVGCGNTDALVKRMNETVANPNAEIALGTGANAVRGPQTLLYLVNWMWNELIEPVPANLIKDYTQMFDPDADEGKTGSMMSHVKHGFKTLGIAFRGDTRSYAEFGTEGFTARFAIPPGKPYHVAGAWGTVAARGMAFDRSARDFANQTGVCVARNLVGSMKFVGARNDEDDEVTSTKGWLHAIQFRQGCDTEQMQRDRVLASGTKSLLWRAGEKAAYAIPKSDFLASAQFEVDRPYSTKQGITTFKYRRLTNWEYHGPNASVREYLETAAQTCPVGEWKEFGTEADWASG